MYGKCARIFTVYWDGNFKWFQVIPKKTGNVIEMMDGMQIIINYVNIFIYIHIHTHIYIYTPSRCTRVPFAHYGSLYFRTSDVCSVLLRKISSMHLPSIVKLGTPGCKRYGDGLVLRHVGSTEWSTNMVAQSHATGCTCGLTKICRQSTANPPSQGLYDGEANPPADQPRCETPNT